MTSIAFPRLRRKRKLMNPIYPSVPVRRRDVPEAHSSSDSEKTSIVSSDSDGVLDRARTHRAVIKNMNHVDRDLHLYSSAKDLGLMTCRLRVNNSERRRRHYLHASRVRRYQHVHPAFYHSNVATREISTPALLELLGRFDSVNDRSRYAHVPALGRAAYLRCFVGDVRSEGTLCVRFNIFVTRVVELAQTSPEAEQYVKDDCERYAAASGFLCKRKYPGRDDVIDEDAGYMGKTDCVFFFGSPKELQDEILCAIEFKHLKTPNIVVGHRWMTVSGALIAQILQSLVGHDAPVGLAITEQGFRVFVREEVEDGTTVIHTWPAGENFYYPHFEGPVEDDEGLQILIDIIRLATRPKELPSAAQSSRPSSRGGTAPSSPRTPPKSDEESSNEPAQKKPRGDKTLRIRSVDGAIRNVKSLCLESRFTPEELRLIAEVEKELESEQEESH